MIRGMDDLERKLAALGQVANENMETIVGRQMKRVQSAARLLCPVHDSELRRSIQMQTENTGDRVVGTVYTNKKYAPYVEFGTGPKGEADHSGISPVVSVSYSQSPWWIHEDDVDAKTAEEYRWFYIDTPEGRFYRCSGQAAQPFMYPALKDNEERIAKTMENVLKREFRKVCK